METHYSVMLPANSVGFWQQKPTPKGLQRYRSHGLHH